MNIVLTLLAGLGILLALFGLRLDYFFAQTFDGLGLSQLLLIVGGLLLFLMCFRLRRGDARRRVWADIRERWRAALLISLVTLLALELILTAGGIPTYYPPDIRGIPIEEAPWWTCDELSCGFVQEAAGFSDKQDSTARARGFDERPRLLFLGDSFTFGWAADIGKSYVETIKANLPQSVIWNMGMPGNGTDRAWTLFQMYAPSLRPQITVLGFYMNDFDDNKRQPLNERIIGRRFAWRYGIVASRNGIKLDAHTTYYYVHGLAPPTNGIQEWIGHTRLGALAMKTIDLVNRRRKGRVLDPAATREYLRLLREAAAAQDTALLVLLIPFRSDIASPGLRYQTALRLFEELEMPYLPLIHALDAERDYDLPGNSHWNSAGHQKVGAMLSDCLAAFEIRQDLSDCEGVVMP